ncbi:hypothetical protein BC835DRAFT_1344945 [Cytidiella melzeri]|nr:hypothetical protein BC835DRAFT_1344945 [Cytidiella melzeri]
MNFLRKLAKNTRGNKKDAKRLLKRIEAIERSWTTTNDTHALHCRSVLTEELDAKRKKLKEIIQEKITQRTFTASDTKEVIEGYIRDVEQALNDYERSLVENIHRLQVEQIVRPFNDRQHLYPLILDHILARTTTSGTLSISYLARRTPGLTHLGPKHARTVSQAHGWTYYTSS